MHWNYSANAAFFGLRRDRFTQYQAERTLQEKVELVKKVDGVTGIELKYPKDFQDPAETKRLLDDHGLRLSAVNVDIKDAKYFLHGALSNRSAETRGRAVGMLTAGMDLAVEFGANLVTTCPLADGYDHAFQVDHTVAWGHFVDSARTAASHRDDVRLAIEYQPHEPHARIMLCNVGAALHVCASAGVANLGVNLDVGHSFAAGESPAEAAALLHGAGRLFYIHSNDNTGDGGDWDMISGSVHFWDWLELLYQLRRLGYDGWIGADIAPKFSGPVESFRANVAMIERMADALDRLDGKKLDELVAADGGVAETFEFLSAGLIGGASS